MLSDADKAYAVLGITVAENTNAMLAYWDKDLICRYANKAYIHWFGVDPADMIDKMHIKDLLGHLYENNLPFIKTALSGKICVFDRYISLPNGQTKKARANYIPHIEQGEVKGFYVNVLDVGIISENPDADKLNVFDHTVSYLSLPSNDHLLEDVVETLRSSIFDNFPGIEFLAKKHYISESKLKRDFKEKYGETIFGYYRHLQMELAHEYITQKKANKGQMAVMLNFSNPSNFSACYRAYIYNKLTGQLSENSAKETGDKYLSVIEQTPFLMAVLDDELRFLKASEKFVAEHGLHDTEYIGRCIYDIWPEIKELFQKRFNRVLKGEIDAPGQNWFEANGPKCLKHWDIKPWYKMENCIGGILIYSENVATDEHKDDDHKNMLAALNTAHEIARIGAWEFNFISNKYTWNTIVKQILEVPEDFDPKPDDVLALYKDDTTREKMVKLREESMKKGLQFDVGIDMITAKGNPIKVRVIGYPSIVNGKCEKIFGILQDVTKHLEHKLVTVALMLSTLCFYLPRFEEELFL